MLLLVLLQCALLANAAGIGGGPFYVPLFNSVLVRRPAMLATWALTTP